MTSWSPLRSTNGCLLSPSSASGAPFKPAFGLSGLGGVVFPCALGFEAISGIRTKPFRYVLLLSSSSLVHDRHKQEDVRRCFRTHQRQFRSVRLRIRGDAG